MSSTVRKLNLHSNVHSLTSPGTFLFRTEINSSTVILAMPFCAFLPPAPVVSLRFAAPLGAAPRPTVRPSAPNTPTALFGHAHDKYAEWAEELWGAGAGVVRQREARRHQAAEDASDAAYRAEVREVKVTSKRVGDARDFAPAGGEEDGTCRSVTVSGVRPVSACGGVVEIIVDVGGTMWESAHVRPGQFLQVGVKGKFGFFTIASAPGSSGMAFLVRKSEDRVGLAGLKIGQEVRIGVVMGAGFEAESLVLGRNLYLLADCMQGFAAIRSLCDWDEFKAQSGSGANRRTSATVYVEMAGSKSLMCVDRLSRWAMYGINVVPVVGVGLVQFLRGGGIGGIGAAVGNDTVAVACVSDMPKAENIFASLNGVGVARDRFHMFTSATVEREFEIYEDGDDVGESMWAGSPGPAAKEKPVGMPDDVYDYVERRKVEDEVWERWVGVRDAMRSEFIRKWANPSTRSSRESAAREAEQKQAWASWFAVNREQWTSQQWDDVKWGGYWKGWQTEQTNWGAEWGRKTTANPWGASGSAWSQSRSDEFWDAAYQSSSGGGGGGGGGTNYGSSGGWGNAKTKADPRGYRYNYQEPAGGSGSGYSGASGGASGSRQNAWNNAGGQRSYSSGTRGSRGASSGGGGGGGFASTDFYVLLGVNKGSSKSEIKKAYRKQALANHPDLNPGAGSTQKMQEIIVAYMTLKDTSKRSQYDRFGI